MHGYGQDIERTDRRRGVFVISVAAELAGMHPQTLRSYEREGLISPQRTPGGTRLYSEADIELLRRIGRLAQQGINLAGIRRIIELEDENARLRLSRARGLRDGNRARRARRAATATPESS